MSSGFSPARGADDAATDANISSRRAGSGLHAESCASRPPPALGEGGHKDRRWRSALHEAAHGVVAIACGADVELLSIRPGKSHAGIAFSTYPTWSGDIEAAISPPGPFVPSDLRRIIEIRMAVCLAGERGELMAAPPLTGYRPPPECGVEAQTLARELADVSPRHVELLLAAEAQTEDVRTDDELAEEASAGMGVGLERAAHLAYMGEVASRLVRDLEREIVSVASELYRRKLMNGAEVRAAMGPPIPRSGEHFDMALLVLFVSRDRGGSVRSLGT